ncbi:hypothetical protein [Paraburkholderia fungorum]|uniref:SHOCT domain-containing protein n=1 Tax=Paraburkholderia fungorum TaxID=134537 RepID=A0A420FUU9_9BURK|nr:hypothetical protein [Paraburkholderia fungorum]RKF36729.1 hypothetical protein BCY88_35430 [Paraburkholderia fungorum]
MGKLIVFLILGFMAYAVLKQLLRVVHFFEPSQQQQTRSPEPGTVSVATPDVVPAKVEGGLDWAEEIKRTYDLFKTGALTEEEFEQVKVQLLARVGAED